MKTLLIFGGACAILVGAAVWQVAPLLATQPPTDGHEPRAGATLAHDGSGADHAPEDAPVESGDRAPRAMDATPVPRRESVPARDPVQIRESVLPQAPAPVQKGNEAGPQPRSTSGPVRWAHDSDRAAAADELKLARAALRDDPWHPWALRDELGALARLGRWSEARLTIGRLVELEPDNLEIQFEQAAILLRLGWTVEAVDVLNDIVGADPTHAQAWFNLAVAHQSLGHLDAARSAWNRTIALSPTAEAHANRAQVHLALGDDEAAVGDLEAVLRMRPTRDARMNLAAALMRLQRYDAAGAILTEVHENHPGYLPAVNRLVELHQARYEASGRTDAQARAAVAQWCRLSLVLDPEQAEVRKMLEWLEE